MKELMNLEDTMIRAANKAEISSHQLFDVFNCRGLMGVYHLGMQHMYEYLRGEQNEKTV